MATRSCAFRSLYDFMRCGLWQSVQWAAFFVAMGRVLIKVEDLFVTVDADTIADLLGRCMAIRAEHSSLAVHGLLVAGDRGNFFQKEFGISRDVISDRTDALQACLP